ncbi:uncharacterized protein LOC108664596 isoform X2 [Hyalella azteca]|uniref:Uncharacterized protein LOC108664596 isoform X2 n=1 Tax=Hyalella azteca TaxID=294128 RepID=A0A979FWA9_HYAAZ|nr:uncharacterized protein LOC108664596 isoform X2 [Hyalella azteca]
MLRVDSSGDNDGDVSDEVTLDRALPYGYAEPRDNFDTNSCASDDASETKPLFHSKSSDATIVCRSYQSDEETAYEVHSSVLAVSSPVLCAAIAVASSMPCSPVFWRVELPNYSFLPHEDYDDHEIWGYREVCFRISFVNDRFMIRIEELDSDIVKALVNMLYCEQSSLAVQNVPLLCAFLKHLECNFGDAFEVERICKLKGINTDIGAQCVFLGEELNVMNIDFLVSILVANDNEQEASVAMKEFQLSVLSQYQLSYGVTALPSHDFLCARSFCDLVNLVLCNGCTFSAQIPDNVCLGQVRHVAFATVPDVNVNGRMNFCVASCKWSLKFEFDIDTSELMPGLTWDLGYVKLVDCSCHNYSGLVLKSLCLRPFYTNRTDNRFHSSEESVTDAIMPVKFVNNTLPFLAKRFSTISSRVVKENENGHPLAKSSTPEVSSIISNARYTDQIAESFKHAPSYSNIFEVTCRTNASRRLTPSKLADKDASPVVTLAVRSVSISHPSQQAMKTTRNEQDERDHDNSKMPESLDLVQPSSKRRKTELGQELFSVYKDTCNHENISSIEDNKLLPDVFSIKSEVQTASCEVSESEEKYQASPMKIDTTLRKCPACSMRFVSPQEVLIHMQQHLGEIPRSYGIRCVDPRCPVLVKVFNETSHLLKHVVRSMHDCRYCSFSSGTRGGLARHHWIHEQRGRVRCKKERDAVGDDNDDELNSDQEITSAPDTSFQMKRFNCGGNMLSSLKTRKVKRKIRKNEAHDEDFLPSSRSGCRSGGRSVSTPHLGIRLPQYDDLHFRENTPDEIAMFTPPKNCYVCGLGFSETDSAVDMALHYYEQHKNLVPFECPFPQCPLVLRQAALMLDHLRNHMWRQRFSCVDCSYSANASKTIKLHARAHVHVQKPVRRRTGALCNDSDEEGRAAGPGRSDDSRVADLRGMRSIAPPPKPATPVCAVEDDTPRSAPVIAARKFVQPFVSKNHKTSKILPCVAGSRDKFVRPSSSILASQFCLMRSNTVPGRHASHSTRPQIAPHGKSPMTKHRKTAAGTSEASSARRVNAAGQKIYRSNSLEGSTDFKTPLKVTHGLPRNGKNNEVPVGLIRTSLAATLSSVTITAADSYARRQNSGRVKNDPPTSIPISSIPGLSKQQSELLAQLVSNVSVTVTMTPPALETKTKSLEPFSKNERKCPDKRKSTVGKSHDEQCGNNNKKRQRKDDAQSSGLRLSETSIKKAGKNASGAFELHTMNPIILDNTLAYSCPHCVAQRKTALEICKHFFDEHISKSEFFCPFCLFYDVLDNVTRLGRTNFRRKCLHHLLRHYNRNVQVTNESERPHDNSHSMPVSKLCDENCDNKPLLMNGQNCNSIMSSRNGYFSDENFIEPARINPSLERKVNQFTAEENHEGRESSNEQNSFSDQDDYDFVPSDDLDDEDDLYSPSKPTKKRINEASRKESNKRSKKAKREMFRPPAKVQKGDNEVACVDRAKRSGDEYSNRFKSSAPRQNLKGMKTASVDISASGSLKREPSLCNNTKSAETREDQTETEGLASEELSPFMAYFQHLYRERLKAVAAYDSGHYSSDTPLSYDEFKMPLTPITLHGASSFAEAKSSGLNSTEALDPPVLGTKYLLPSGQLDHCSNSALKPHGALKREGGQIQQMTETLDLKLENNSSSQLKSNFNTSQNLNNLRQYYLFFQEFLKAMPSVSEQCNTSESVMLLANQILSSAILAQPQCRLNSELERPGTSGMMELDAAPFDLKNQLTPTTSHDVITDAARSISLDREIQKKYLIALNQLLFQAPASQP